MIPQEDNAVLGDNYTSFVLGPGEYSLGYDGWIIEDQKYISSLAHEELNSCLENSKMTLTEEEHRKLLVWAYQGCDLRYQRDCDKAN